MDRDEIPSKFEQWSYIWDKWHQVLAEKKVNATRACMCYPLSLEQVNKVVVGVVNSKQLEELIVITRDTNDYNINDFSFLCTDDENLVNPSKWVGL